MNDVTGQARKQAEIKAAKRAEALRANLKRRKESEAAKIAAADSKSGNKKGE